MQRACAGRNAKREVDGMRSLKRVRRISGKPLDRRCCANLETRRGLRWVTATPAKLQIQYLRTPHNRNATKTIGNPISWTKEGEGWGPTRLTVIHWKVRSPLGRAWLGNTSFIPCLDIYNWAAPVSYFPKRGLTETRFFKAHLWKVHVPKSKTRATNTPR